MLNALKTRRENVKKGAGPPLPLQFTPRCVGQFVIIACKGSFFGRKNLATVAVARGAGGKRPVFFPLLYTYIHILVYILTRTPLPCNIIKTPKRLSPVCDAGVFIAIWFCTRLRTTYITRIFIVHAKRSYYTSSPPSGYGLTLLTILPRQCCVISTRNNIFYLKFD